MKEPAELTEKVESATSTLNVADSLEEDKPQETTDSVAELPVPLCTDSNECTESNVLGGAAEVEKENQSCSEPTPLSACVITVQLRQESLFSEENLAVTTQQEAYTQDVRDETHVRPAEEEALPGEIQSENVAGGEMTMRREEVQKVKEEGRGDERAPEEDVSPVQEDSSSANVIVNCEFCNYQCMGHELLEAHVNCIHRTERLQLKRSLFPAEVSRSKMKRYYAKQDFESRQHHCDSCMKSYEKKDSLKQHIRVAHSVLEPHCCGMCGAKFAHRSFLSIHQKKTHGVSQAALSTT